MSVQLDRRAEELRLRVVRRAMRHDSAPKHVAGKASFIDDIREPEGLLHIAVGGAPIAAGQLLGVDLDAGARRARRRRGADRRRHSGQERRQPDRRRRSGVRRQQDRVLRPGGVRRGRGDARAGAQGGAARQGRGRGRNAAGLGRRRARGRDAHPAGLQLPQGRQRGGAREQPEPGRRGSCASAGRSTSTSKARCRSPFRARTATCWCIARPSIRANAST